MVATEVAGTEPFRTALAGYHRESPVRDPEWYAVCCDRIGLFPQHVRLQVYLHHLTARDDVVEWVRGTLLTDYQARMPEALFERVPGHLPRAPAPPPGGHPALPLPVQAHPVLGPPGYELSGCRGQCRAARRGVSGSGSGWDQGVGLQIWDQEFLAHALAWHGGSGAVGEGAIA